MFAHGENQSFLAEQVRKRQMETAALRAERDRATQHTVVIDGMRVAPGTRLSPAEIGDDSVPTENVLPAPPPLPDFPMQGAASPAGPAGMGPGGMFPNGKRVPPPAINMRMRPTPAGKPGQPPSAASRTPPSEQEVNALIQASALRAGKRSAE